MAPPHIFPNLQEMPGSIDNVYSNKSSSLIIFCQKRKTGLFSVFVQEQADSRQHDKRGSQGPLGEEAEVLSVFCEGGFLRG